MCSPRTVAPTGETSWVGGTMISPMERHRDTDSVICFPASVVPFHRLHGSGWGLGSAQPSKTLSPACSWFFCVVDPSELT